MFEKLIEELENLKTNPLSIPIEFDDEGFLDRECPNEKCLFKFKVLGNDWKEIFKDEAVHCPKCGNKEPSNKWYTTEQVKQAGEQGKEVILAKIGNALKDGAHDFNSRQRRNTFISMRLEVTSDHHSDVILPITALKEMQLKIKCEKCNANYAVIGSAFFCPCCGNNSSDQTFDQSMKKVKDKIKNLATIKAAISEISEDEADTTCTSLVETSLNECVVAFQRFCDQMFSENFPEVNVKFNAFQNLEKGSKYWENKLSKSYEDWISPKELELLIVFFQQRHLLSHTEGIVDDKYIERSKDETYEVGQRIVIKENDVIKCSEILIKLKSEIKKAIANK